MSNEQIKPECQLILSELYTYLDGEATQDRLDSIAQHLRECPPCLDEHDIEVALRAVVRRSCQEAAPARLRSQIITRITTVQITVDDHR